MIYRIAMIIVLVSFYGFVTGCAKQPALMQASAPAPTGQPAMAPPAPAAPAPAAPPAPPAPAPAAPAPPASAPVAAPPAAPPAVERPPVKDFTVVVDLRPIYFDFDKAEIRPDAAGILDTNAQWLNANLNYVVLIEGHGDERGTNEYNFALGERRALATLNYLMSRGVQRNRITVISYGEERPVCTEHNEACWSKNRRAVPVAKAG